MIFLNYAARLLFIICFSTQVFAQINLNSPLPVDPDVKIGKLSNGLTYYIRKNEKPAKKIELRLVVNAGSVLEENNQLGLAHFMEHMGFNGSKNFPKNDLVNYLQSVGVKFGADLNAYTGFDETVYILPISSDKPEVVEKGFTVLEDWAFNNLMDKNEIEKERGVVLEESRLSKGSNERMRRQYFPQLFNGSKYAERLPIGKDSILKTFKPELLQQFYKEWYRPNLMAVIVAGDIDVATAEQKIKEHFGSYKNPEHLVERPAIIPITQRTQPQAMVVTDDEATNTILQIFNYVRPDKPAATWADYKKLVEENLMTSLINQRLQELTQRENPPFNFAGTNMGPFIRGYKAFISFAVLGNNSPQEAVDALIAETERARQYGFLKSELERAKADLLNQTQTEYSERNKLESGTYVSEYIDNFLEGTPIPGVANRYQFIKDILPSITVDSINAVAKDMPRNNNAFALVLAPSNRRDKLPGNDALMNAIVAASNKPVKPYEEKAIAVKLLDKEPAAGKVVKSTKNAALGTTDLTLSNGITVTLKPTNFKNDQIVMDAWRLGGFNKFPLADKENAQYAANIVTQMGVKNLTPTDLQKFLSGKTASVHPYINNNEEGIEGASSIPDFETFLQLTYLYFTQPRRDETLFHSFVKKQKGSLQFLRQNPQVYFQDTLTKIVYNNNPWANSIPTEDTFDRLNLDRSLAIYNQIYSNAYGMHFTFVGNTDSVKIIPLLEKYLGSLPAAPKENKDKDNGVRPVRGVVNATIKRGKEAQSVITTLFSGPTTYSTQDELAFRALIEVLNIKVVEKLREEMSGIYGGGFYGAIEKRPYVHYTISSRIPCGPENVDKLTEALLGLIKTAQQKGIDQKDLDKVKETWRKQYGVNIQENEFWLQSLSSAWIDKRNPMEILQYQKMIAALTPQQLQKTAQKYFDFKNYVKAVLYPENAAANDANKPAKPF